MVSLRDRPDSGGSAPVWMEYLESWIGMYTESNGLYTVGKGILGTKIILVEKSWKQDRRLVLANLLTSFTEAFYSSEKSGLNRNSPIESRWPPK